MIAAARATQAALHDVAQENKLHVVLQDLDPNPRM
jgi:hypothetical protein